MNPLNHPVLHWIESDAPLPPLSQAWGAGSAAPGLLCAGGDLAVRRLVDAYSQGIFPWFSGNQPILWWSPSPRMVLELADFRLHRSLRKVLTRFARDPNCEIRVDSAFEAVISQCARTARPGQGGSWIVPSMVRAYTDLHHAGFAHSVETWIQDKLVGGLYFVAIGQAVYGESMFHHATDASKIALAALVALCRHHKIKMIDCQQNTGHLASLGGKEVSRDWFVQEVNAALNQAGPNWTFAPVYWREIALF